MHLQTNNSTKTYNEEVSRGDFVCHKKFNHRLGKLRFKRISIFFFDFFFPFPENTFFSQTLTHLGMSSNN